jgi:hypothetical protein
MAAMLVVGKAVAIAVRGLPRGACGAVRGRAGSRA